MGRVSLIGVGIEECELVGKNRKMVRRFQEPNRPEAGGKGWFLFCLEQNYTLEDPQTLLQPIWRTAVRPNKLRSLI